MELGIYRIELPQNENRIYSYTTLNDIIPSAKKLKFVNKSLNEKLYMVLNGKEVVGPLETGDSSPIECSLFGLKQRIMGNLNDVKAVKICTDSRSRKLPVNNVSIPIFMNLEGAKQSMPAMFTLSSMEVSFRVNNPLGIVEDLRDGKAYDIEKTVDVYTRKVVNHVVSQYQYEEKEDILPFIQRVINEFPKKVDTILRNGLNTLPYISLYGFTCDLKLANAKEVYQFINEPFNRRQKLMDKFYDLFFNTAQTLLQNPPQSISQNPILLEYMNTNPGMGLDDPDRIKSFLMVAEQLDAIDRKRSESMIKILSCFISGMQNGTGIGLGSGIGLPISNSLYLEHK